MAFGFAGPACRPGGRPGFAVVRPHLLVGEYPSPADAGWLATEHGVTAVVCLQDHGDLAAKNLRLADLERAYRAHAVTFHHVPVPDGDGEALAARLDDVLAVLDAVADAGGRAYLHCSGGFNRAPTVAIAHLWAREGLSLEDARAAVSAQRACVPYLRVLAAYCRR